ncbi:methyl-accepting chemotaxis protein [Clostridium sp.]|jgi:uncharacterized protein YfkK (UPF0435 family)|uniref:methyl-accepting chemotaxis protein n=1 Tax=Clostridium sp. TaxID=1506 RepID=UPI0039F645B3
MQNKYFSSDVLEEVYNCIPYIDTFFDNDIEIMLTDREKVLYYQGSKEIDAKIQEGAEVGKFVRQAMEVGEIEVKVIPEDFIGVAFKSYMIPIKEGNTVIGSLAIGKSLSKKNAVTNITQGLITALTSMETVANQISSAVQKLADKNGEILNETNLANDIAHDTDNIVSFIKGVSSQTNLLGLNASIEAARAGDYGNGFNIVAQEIRKLSKSSSESMVKIEDIIKSISSSIKRINDKVVNVEEISHQQSEALQQMAVSIEQLNSTAKLLGKLADEL